MWKFQSPSWKDLPTRYATRRKIRKVELREGTTAPISEDGLDELDVERFSCRGNYLNSIRTPI